MSLGLLGKKLGMTRVYDDKGVSTPVTVIAAAGNKVLQVKTVDTDGYVAVQVGFDDQKASRVSKAQNGHFAKTSATPKRFIREFRNGAAEAGAAASVIAIMPTPATIWIRPVCLMQPSLGTPVYDATRCLRCEPNVVP